MTAHIEAARALYARTLQEQFALGAFNPTATLYSSFGLSPLSMHLIVIVITPLHPGNTLQDRFKVLANKHLGPYMR